MSAAHAVRLDLGAFAEARIADAFAESLTITAKACARLLGVDVTSLREMDDAGLIGGVIIGASTRAYTEADVRAYLAGEPPLARVGHKKPERKPRCRSTGGKRPANIGNTISSRKGVGFTDPRARLHVVKP